MSRRIQQRIFNRNYVRENFADVSPYYDYWAKFTESEATQLVLELVDINKHDLILEAGVGTGILLEQIVDRNPGGFTAGIDLSPDMLAKAKKRSEKFKKQREFKLTEGSVYEIPFPDEKFDCLISCYVLDLLPEEDFLDILREFKRVLKPKGGIVLASMSFGWMWYHHFWEWMANEFPNLMTDCRPVELEPFVEEAGFSIEIVEQISQNTFPSQVLKATKDKI